MKILIGTKNPGKIEGAKRALSNYFDNIEIEGIPVESNVGEPVSYTHLTLPTTMV